MLNRAFERSATLLAVLVALALSCLDPLTASAQANGTEGGAIVGLWQVHYTSDFGPQFDTYQQWHSDGMDIESPSFSPGVCMGVWKQVGNRTVQLYHVGWTPGGIPPAPTAVRFVLTTTSTVSLDRNSFDGRYDQQFFDADGKLVLEDMGATHATRITLDLLRVSEGKPTARSTRAFC
ncbi:MAG TPA: hypothetical protein VI259_11390 [Gemmatimonadaceae bacterium]